MFSRPDKKELWDGIKESGMVLKRMTFQSLLLNAFRDNDIEFAAEITQKMDKDFTPEMIWSPSFLTWCIESKNLYLRQACDKIACFALEASDPITECVQFITQLRADTVLPWKN